MIPPQLAHSDRPGATCARNAELILSPGILERPDQRHVLPIPKPKKSVLARNRGPLLGPTKGPLSTRYKWSKPKGSLRATQADKRAKGPVRQPLNSTRSQLDGKKDKTKQKGKAVAQVERLISKDNEEQQLNSVQHNEAHNMVTDGDDFEMDRFDLDPNDELTSEEEV